MFTIVTDARKHSAGLLLLSGKRLLVLERAPGTRNPGTWGLPGGQRNAGEAAYEAAVREANEEMGGAPPHLVVGEVAVQRSARRYEVFACRTPRDRRAHWRPRLDKEHIAWRWVSLKWCLRNKRRLHPVLRALVEDDAGLHWLSRMVERKTPARRLPGGRRASDGVRAAS